MNYTLDNFDSKLVVEQPMDPYDIEISNADASQLITKLNVIYDAEEKAFDEKKVFPNVGIHMKGMDTEVLVEFFKNAFKRPTLVDRSTHLNLNLILNSYNTFDKSVFEDQDVVFSDVTQFLDVSSELEKEIAQFSREAVFWYLASLKSMHKIDYTDLDNFVRIPNIYERFLTSNSSMCLSVFMNKMGTMNFEELPLVYGGYSIVMHIHSQDSISLQLFNTIEKQLSEQDANA